MRMNFQFAEIKMKQQTFLKRHVTPESIRFDQNRQRLDKHVLGATAKFADLVPKLRPLAAKVKKEFPKNNPDSKKKRKKLLVQLLKKNRQVMSYINRYMLPSGENLPRLVRSKIHSWTEKILYQFRNVLLDRSYKIGNALPVIEKHARWGFEAKMKAIKQENIRKEIPSESIIEHLPQNIVINVDEDGKIQEFSELLANEFDTIEIKAQKMKNLIRKYNEVASKVKRDLSSSNELTRLSALITSIIMETGIRPGKIGQKTMQNVDGEKIPVQTFGAITLGPEHVNFIRDNFAELEFTGKKGQINLAQISDPQIIAMLRDYVERAVNEELPFIFVTSDGERFDYKHYQRYFREEVLSEFTASDFRKLRATQVVLNKLREQQFELYREIREVVGQSSKEVKQETKDQVLKLVESAVVQAYHDAHVALSHDKVSTTVDSYVNPEVLLRFLNQGFIEDKIEDVLLGDRPYLSLDIQSFIKEAMKHA
jgi:integrase